MHVGGKSLGHLDHRLQLGMPHDDHPVADERGPPVSARGADRQQVDEYDVLAVLGQQLVQALNVSDSPDAPGPFEDTTGIELALERRDSCPCTTASAHATNRSPSVA